jgi:ABC-2 type transport system ATP-binding protein
MIEIKDCIMRFDDVNAVDGITTVIPEGSCYGLLGSNGAGKSTVLRMLAGIYRPASGSVKIDGEDVYDNVKIKEKVFYISDETVQFSDMTLAAMRNYYAMFYKSFDRALFDKLVQTVGLPLDKKLHEFSKGMKRQAVVICGIACRPKYLLLDEALDGLDPTMRLIVKKMMIDAMLDREMTIVFSSHNLNEIDEFCDRVGLLHSGKLVFDRELENVKGDVIKVQASFDKEVTAADFPGIEVLHTDRTGSVTYIIAKGGSGKIRAEIEKLSPKMYDEIRLTLEEIFVYEMEGLGYDSSALDR